MSPYQRHIDACNTGQDTTGLLPLRLGGAQIGFLSPILAAGVPGTPEGIALPGPEALTGLATRLAARGHFRLRGELFDVRETATGPVLGTLDRGALPALGVIGQGVHVNGLVPGADGLRLWIGIRSRSKAVAPGQLDNLIAGGISAGLSPEECLVKEAGEEASLPPELARQARRSARLSYQMRVPEGLRRDVMHVFDLELPAGFEPRPNDGEVERFELWPAEQVLAAVRDSNSVKFNVNLAMIDLALRKRLIDPASDEGMRLRAGLDQGPR